MNKKRAGKKKEDIAGVSFAPFLLALHFPVCTAHPLVLLLPWCCLAVTFSPLPLQRPALPDRSPSLLLCHYHYEHCFFPQIQGKHVNRINRLTLSALVPLKPLSFLFYPLAVISISWPYTAAPRVEVLSFKK